MTQSSRFQIQGAPSETNDTALARAAPRRCRWKASSSIRWSGPFIVPSIQGRVPLSIRPLRSLR